MMSSRQTEGEHCGSRKFSKTDETLIEWRKASIAIEESAEKKLNSRCVIEKNIAWKTFKSLVFLICLFLMIIQSAEFLNMYYKYPTNIMTKTTVSKDFKLPAITLCFRSSASFTTFCLNYPNSCKKPSNITQFCKERPYNCPKDTSNLMIPKDDVDTRRNVQHFLRDDSFNDERLFDFYSYGRRRLVKRALARVTMTLYDRKVDDKHEDYEDEDDDIYVNKYMYEEEDELKDKENDKEEEKEQDKVENEDEFISYDYTTKARTFVEDNLYSVDYRDVLQEYLKCYSNNLHLFQSGSKLATHTVDFLRRYGDTFSIISLFQGDIDLFYPLDAPKVFLGIHSPYHPINTKELLAIMPGKSYRIDVQLMCLELCRSEYERENFDCDHGMTMISSTSDLCEQRYFPQVNRSISSRDNFNFSGNERTYENDKRLSCMENCKQECLKLQYKYRVQEISNGGGEGPQTKLSFIYLYVQTPEVTVLRHVPLYSSGELFSHVGGLLGCWLGISVFTFTNTIEKLLRKGVRWKKRIRLEKVQEAQTSEIPFD